MNADNSFSSLDLEAIEELYKKYLDDNDSVDESFKYFFRGSDLATANFPLKPVSSSESEGKSKKEFNVLRLINGYRSRGHLFTKTNPVRERRSYSPTLDLENFGLSDADLDVEFQAGNEVGLGRAKLRDIIALLQDTYCASIGVEYRYMTKPEKVTWLQEKMERSRNREVLSSGQKMHILNLLVKASGFEDYLHKKFVGQKRFSLEGSEAIIPALEAIIAHGGHYNVSDIVVGMAHRGRLNVLANIMGKPYGQIFKEYNAQNYGDRIFHGDVKYHLGYDNVIHHDGRDIAVSLVPNPSHLETVGPVVQGVTRAKLENEYNFNYEEVLPILIHGDSAIAGQGVVYETIQFSTLNGYKTGGTIHIVINNQVGFTTNYLQARSSTYCTDIAKVTQSPVFHVNGDDVEAMVYVAKLALEFRQKYHTDVFIDLLSYRKYGHNEGDEPRFTQPKLYDIIAKHKNPRDIYGERLIGEKVIESKDLDSSIEEFESLLNEEYDKSVETVELDIQPFMAKHYIEFHAPTNKDFIGGANTSIGKDQFLKLADKITTLPGNRTFFNKTKRLFAQRKEMIEKDSFDWAMGELMAYASLSVEGYPIRLSGQDSERGTFSHRHAEIVTQDEGEEKYFPLKDIDENQAPVRVYNSPLNEYGILGFEYGYSLPTPNGLTIWEAQFGDFYNVGQVIVDQYISSALDKWGLMSGLVLYLPHGYEGQGAEHSSGRIERFLGLCANNNMQVVNCTTPANMFHVLRRQIHSKYRVPLVVFTPKSLLRHPECVSSIKDFTEGSFMPVYDDNLTTNDNAIRRVLLCSGKIYYELLSHRRDSNIDDVAIIRVEQLYPFPKEQLESMLDKYPIDIELMWVQEEPLNMGAATFVREQFEDCSIRTVGRPRSGVTAEGLSALHKLNQGKIIEQAFSK